MFVPSSGILDFNVTGESSHHPTPTHPLRPTRCHGDWGGGSRDKIGKCDIRWRSSFSMSGAALPPPWGGGGVSSEIEKKTSGDIQVFTITSDPPQSADFKNCCHLT